MELPSYSLLHKLRHYFLREDAKGSIGHFTFHARPLRAKYQLLHAQIFVFVYLINTLFGATDYEPSFQHLLKGHIYTVGLG